MKSTQNWIQFYSNKKFSFCIFQMNFAMTTLGLKEMYLKKLLVKSSQNNHTFLPAFYPNWKNIHRCQNSLRWEISLIWHENIGSLKQKLSFLHDMVSKNDPNIIYYIQYRLHLMRTILGQYSWNQCLPCLKMHNFRVNLGIKVSFDISEKNGYVFKILSWVRTHMFR